MLRFLDCPSFNLGSGGDLSSHSDHVRGRCEVRDYLQTINEIMKHIKLRKIVRKQKSLEQSKKNFDEQNALIMYWGLGEIEKINDFLKGKTNKL